MSGSTGLTEHWSVDSPGAAAWEKTLGVRHGTTVEVEAPPERVWEVLVDVERWPEWTQSMREVSLLGGGAGLAEGAQARVRQPGMPALVWEVTEFAPGRSFTWENSSPGVKSVATHSLTPSPAGGTTVRLGLVQSGVLAPAVGLLTSGRVKRYVQMEADGLKKRSESR